MSKPAFIRKVSKELIDLLRSQGYSGMYNSNSDYEGCGIATSCISGKKRFRIIYISSFDETNPHRTWNCAGRIDCKEDDFMFVDLL